MSETVAEIEEDISTVGQSEYAPIPLAHKFGKEGLVTRKRIVIPGDGNFAVFGFEVEGTRPDNLEFRVLSPEEMEASEPQGEVLEEQEGKADPETYDVDETTEELETDKEPMDEEEKKLMEAEEQEPEEEPEAVDPEQEVEKKEDTPEPKEMKLDDEEAPEDMDQLADEANDGDESTKDEADAPNFDFPYETDSGEPIAGFLLADDENTSPAFIMVRPTLDSEGVPDESAKDAMARVRQEHEGYRDADLQAVIARIGNDPLTSGD